MDVDIRGVVAACIHEPFMLRADDEDINILQMIVCELMEENERKVATALAPNLHLVIQQYCNAHTLQENGDGEEVRHAENGPALKHSSTLVNNKVSCMELDRVADKKKGQGLKKQATLMAYESEPLTENLSSNSHYLFLPEYRSEKIYSELLTKIIGFEANLRLMIGPWREHAGFLENFAI